VTIRLLIADDHPVVRSGLVRLLSGTDIEVVGEAASPNEALDLAARHKPDVIILDIRMGNDDCFDVVEKLRRDEPASAIVILSTYDNSSYFAKAVTFGVSDYLLKGASRQQLIATIRAAADGRIPPCGGELRRVASLMNKQGAAQSEQINLTSRESQVLRHLSLGLSNKEIAKAMEISVETVKEHVQNIFRKIHVSDRTQAAVWAIRNGLVDY
jgi:DNA-binding NarL/FixJ family response regulator